MGESDVPARGPPASFSVHLVSSAVIPAGSVLKSRGDNVVLLCVLKTRTHLMYPNKTTIAQIAHPTTCDIASTHQTCILWSRARVGCTSPEISKRCFGARSPRVIAALMSNKAAYPLQTDVESSKRYDYGEMC